MEDKNAKEEIQDEEVEQLAGGAAFPHPGNKIEGLGRGSFQERLIRLEISPKWA